MRAGAIVATLLLVAVPCAWSADDNDCVSPKDIEYFRKAISELRKQDDRLAKLTIDELQKELSKPAPADAPIDDWRLFVAERILRRLKPGETRERIVQLLGKPDESHDETDDYLENFVSSRPVDPATLRRMRIHFEQGLLVSATVMNSAKPADSDSAIKLAK